MLFYSVFVSFSTFWFLYQILNFWREESSFWLYVTRLPEFGDDTVIQGFYISLSECQKLEHGLKCSDFSSPRFVALSHLNPILIFLPSFFSLPLPSLPFSLPSSSHSFPFSPFSLILSSLISQPLNHLIISLNGTSIYTSPIYASFILHLHMLLFFQFLQKLLYCPPTMFPKLRMPSHTPLPIRLTV